MSPTRSRTPVVIGAVLALVAILAVAAVVLSGGGDDEETAVVTPTDGAPAGSATGDGGGASSGAVDPLAAVVTVEGTALVPLENPGDDGAVGAVPPTVRGTDYDGRPVEIVPGAGGRPQLVVVVAHWCPHCNAEVPQLVEWRDSGEIPDNLDIVAISTAASPDRPNYPPGEWLAGEDWQWPVLADDTPSDPQTPPSALAAYGVSGYPFFTLLDADGRVVARRAGEVPIDELAELVAQVA